MADLSKLDKGVDISSAIAKRSLQEDGSVSANTDTVKNSTEMVGSNETINSTKSIVDALVKVFPAGLAEGVVVDRLMSTYHIDKDVAKTCYKSALEEVMKKTNTSKQELQTNASALVSGEDKKKDGMDNLNAWGDYQKMMLDTSSSGSTQGGD